MSIIFDSIEYLYKKRKKKKMLDKLLDQLMTKKGLIALGIAFVIVIGLCVTFLLMPNPGKPEFVPPEFAQTALEGMHEEPKELGYQLIYQEGMGFKVGVCGVVRMEGNKADLYFTNPEENTLWMKLRIFDKEKNIIAETGLIKPGQYLKSVEFTDAPKAGDEISMKVMTYVPESYESGGAFSLNPRVVG